MPCSCSTRPTPCSSPIPVTSTDGPSVLQVGTLSKTLGALGGFVAGSRTATSSCWSTGPAPTSSPPPSARPTPPPRSPRSASLRLARGRRAARPAARPRRAAPPGSPLPDRAVVLGEEAAPWPPRPRCSSRGCSSRRSDRPRWRRAPAGCGSRCRPRTPTPRSTPSPGRSTPWASPSEVDRERRPPRAADRRGRHRHRGGQDLGVGPPAARPAGRGPHRGRPQAGPVVRPRGPHHRRRRARRRHRRGPHRRVPAAPLVHRADGAADGRRRARPAALHHRRPGAGDGLAGAGPEVGLVETAGGVRSPLAADGDAVTLIEELQPDRRAAGGRRRARHDQRCAPRPGGARHGGPRGHPARDAEPVRPRRRPAPSQPELPHRGARCGGPVVDAGPRGPTTTVLTRAFLPGRAA